MNTITKRLKALELAVQKLRQEDSFKLAHRAEGETDEQAKARAGLADWHGPMVYIGFAYPKLPQYQGREVME